MANLPRPNILFLLSDQQRWDTLGCYGQRLALTPNLDRMAGEGVRFERAFTCQPVCGPARACLQTGLFATRTGNVTNGRTLPLDQPTIAKALAAAGYETAYVGKWHLATGADDGGVGSPRFLHEGVPPERRGGYRDYWMASDILEFTSSGYEGYFFNKDGRRVDWEGYRVERTTDFALDYLRQYAARHHRAAGRPPFFLFVSYIEPHQQNDLDRYIGPIGSKMRFYSYDAPGDLAGLEQSAAGNPDWRRHYPDYLGCCWSLDQNVGRLSAALRQLGLADDTLVIYTSDHGCHFRTRNSEYKRSCHEASIRVPLIACGPGFAGGRVVEELVSLIDLPATVVAAAQAPALPQQDGRPIQQLLTGNAADWPADVFVQISESHNGRAIRTRRWKYAVIDPRDIGQPEYRFTAFSSDRYVEQFLYDLDRDPHELDNLVADPAHAAVRAELAQRLCRRLREAGEPDAVIAPAE